MKMLRMGGKMGEMGEMEERKSIGNFCMRVGIFVSMYFTLHFFFILFKREIEKTIQQVTVYLFTVLDISPTPSTPKTPSISSLPPAHHSATKLSNGSTPPKPLFCCMVSHVYTSNGINTMEMSKKLCKDSVGMWSRIWII